MNELMKEFIEFAKEKYDCDVVAEPSDDPDTFEKIFGLSFVDAEKIVDKFNEIPCTSFCLTSEEIKELLDEEH